MRKARLYQLLAVAGGLSTAVATTPVLAADSVTLAAGGGDNAFTIEFLGKSGNTWSYRVSETGRALSHWSLGIANCEGAVTGGTGSHNGNIETGSGGSSDQLLKDTGVDWMVKWDTDGGVGSGEVFTLTLDGDYESADVGVLVKTGGNPKSNVGTITAPDCSTPAEEPPAEEPPAEEPPAEEPPAEEPPVEEPPAEEPPAEEPPVEEPPVEEPTSGGGNPNMACSEIMGSNGAPMSLIAKYETNNSGAYVFEGSGTDIIDIEGNLSGGTFSVDSGVVEVAAVIVKGGTVALPDEDGNDSFSNAGLVNGGGQTADISNVQFCQEGVFDSAGAEVCLWTADKDADGSYINIEQVGCVDAEKGKFYAIEAAGEFSNALEAE